MKQLQFIRINEGFEPQIVVEKMRVVDKQTVEINHQGEIAKEGDIVYADVELVIRHDEDDKTYYSYGLYTRSKGDRPGHGGAWSSNSVAINRIFGLNMAHGSVKTERGEFPGSYFASSMPKNEITLPDCLEWGDDNFIYPKKGFDWPRRKDYFMSTVLDAKGELIVD